MFDFTSVERYNVSGQHMEAPMRQKPKPKSPPHGLSKWKQKQVDRETGILPEFEFQDRKRVSEPAPRFSGKAMNERVSVHLAPVQPAKVGTIFANSYSTQACTLRFLYFGTGYAILVAVADGTKAYISRSVLRKAFGNIRIPDGTLVGGVLIPDDMGTCIQSIEWVEFTKDGLKRLRDQAQEMKRRSGFTTQEEVCSDA